MLGVLREQRKVEYKRQRLISLTIHELEYSAMSPQSLMTTASCALAAAAAVAS